DEDRAGGRALAGGIGLLLRQPQDVEDQVDGGLRGLAQLCDDLGGLPLGQERPSRDQLAHGPLQQSRIQDARGVIVHGTILPHEEHPHWAIAASAVSNAARASGAEPSSIPSAMIEKTSSRSSAVSTVPASELTVESDPVFAWTTPAPARDSSSR